MSDGLIHKPDEQAPHADSGWHALFTFATPHQAMAAQAVLRRLRIGWDEIPPPEQVDAGCGVALRIALGSLYQAVGALATEGAEWEAVYELGEQQEVVARLG